MDQNKLRKLAGLPLLKEWKEVVDTPGKGKDKDDAKAEDAEVKADDKATDKEAAGKDKEEKKDDLPEIITKIAQSVCKKFGIGDPEGGESEDLTAMEDFLKKVYDAGVADGAAAKGEAVKEDAQTIASKVSVHKAYTQLVKGIKAALEKNHSVDGAPLEATQDGDYVVFHLPKKPYNTIGAVQTTLKSFEGNGYEAGNVQ